MGILSITIQKEENKEEILWHSSLGGFFGFHVSPTALLSISR